MLHATCIASQAFVSIACTLYLNTLCATFSGPQFSWVIFVQPTAIPFVISFNLVFAPLETGTKNQKTLENLKSAVQFRFIDLILAITLYLPVCHSHYTKANFTVLVWCSDELAVHSCLLLHLQTRVAKLVSACSTVSLSCVTITWQRNLKGSLQATIINASFRMWLLTSDVFRRWCCEAVTADNG